MEEEEKLCLVKEIAEYMYDGFSILQKHGTKEKVASFIARNLHRIVYIREGSCLVGVAIYMMINDSTLEKIISKEIDLKNEDTFREAEKESGENMHIFSLRADRMSIILKGLKSIFKVRRPKTVSWFKPNMKDIVIIKRGQ